MFDLQKDNFYTLLEIYSFRKILSCRKGRKVSIQEAAKEWIEKYYDIWLRKNKSRFIENHSC